MAKFKVGDRVEHKTTGHQTKVFYVNRKTMEFSDIQGNGTPYFMEDWRLAKDNQLVLPSRQ